MILDLYARLDQRSWVDLARMPLALTLVLGLAIISFTMGAASAQSLGQSTSVKSQGFHFAETTGRAVILDAALQQEARLMALEEALYLAALQGGADINGYSAVMTDTAIEDHFVVRPASRILDYTITDEVIGDQHYEVSIRAAIGSMPRKSCSTRRDINVTVFAPEITQDAKTPAAAGPMAGQIMSELVDAINSRSGVNARLSTTTKLDPARLARANDNFDYQALTTGVVRVRRGDFAIVPEIQMTARRDQSGLDRRDILVMQVMLHLFAGETYVQVDSFAADVEIVTKSSGPIRALNVLRRPNRSEVLAQMRAPVSSLVSKMARKLQCAPITATLSVESGQLTVPVGSHHGMRQNALAVASGTDTPWQILRVTAVRDMQATLVPFNTQRDITRLAGRTVEFMEIPQ